MRLRNIALCALSLLLPVLRVSAQTSAPSGEVTGATVRVTSIDTANNKYTYEIWNKSNKEITTYSFLEKFTYSDGNTRFLAFTHSTWLPGIDGSQPETLQAGQTRTQTLGMSSTGVAGVTTVNVDIELLLLVYGDLTAEVRPDHGERFTGDEMFQDVLANRKSIAQGAQTAVDAITAALSGANDNPAAVALQTLQTFKDNAKHSDAKSTNRQFTPNPSSYGNVSAAELDSDMTILRLLAGHKEERKYLALQLAAMQARAKLASERAQLRRLPGGPTSFRFRNKQHNAISLS